MTLLFSSQFFTKAVFHLYYLNITVKFALFQFFCSYFLSHHTLKDVNFENFSYIYKIIVGNFVATCTGAGYSCLLLNLSKLYLTN